MLSLPTRDSIVIFLHFHIFTPRDTNFLDFTTSLLAPRISPLHFCCLLLHQLVSALTSTLSIVPPRRSTQRRTLHSNLVSHEGSRYLLSDLYTPQPHKLELDHTQETPQQYRNHAYELGRRGRCQGAHSFIFLPPSSAYSSLGFLSPLPPVPTLDNFSYHPQCLVRRRKGGR